MKLHFFTLFLFYTMLCLAFPALGDGHQNEPALVEYLNFLGATDQKYGSSDNELVTLTLDTKNVALLGKKFEMEFPIEGLVKEDPACTKDNAISHRKGRILSISTSCLLSSSQVISKLDSKVIPRMRAIYWTKNSNGTQDAMVLNGSVVIESEAPESLIKKLLSSLSLRYRKSDIQNTWIVNTPNRSPFAFARTLQKMDFVSSAYPTFLTLDGPIQHPSAGVRSQDN